MKKFIMVLLAVCLVIGAAAMYFFGQGGEESTGAIIDGGNVQQQEVTEEISTQTLDIEKLYALHDAAEVVATVGGDDVLWSEYFYWLYANEAQVESYITQMAYYGMDIKWTDTIDESGQTYAQYITDAAESSIIQMHTIEAMAREYGVVLTAEDEAELAETLAADMASTCGEDATEEAFKAFLKENYMDIEVYNRLNRANHLYQNGFNTLYGENGEKVSDEDAVGYLTDNGYMSAGHILLMTVDSATGEELSEEEQAEKKAKADEIYAELSAIEDTGEMLRRFRELKEEFCEDAGKTSYPDGYVYTDGTMVSEFENTAKALEENGISEPVKSTYGYHIILRLPHNPDMTVKYSDSGTALTARMLYANTAYGSIMQGIMDGMEMKYLFEKIDIADFLK